MSLALLQNQAHDSHVAQRRSYSLQTCLGTLYLVRHRGNLGLGSKAHRIRCGAVSFSSTCHAQTLLTYMHIYMYTCLCIRMCICICICTCICICICVYMFVYTYVCMHACMYVCIYIYRYMLICIYTSRIECKRPPTDPTCHASLHRVPGYVSISTQRVREQQELRDSVFMILPQAGQCTLTRPWTAPDGLNVSEGLSWNPKVM